MFAHQYYNDAVATLNKLTQTIPWMFLTGIANVHKRDFYDAPDGQDVAPGVLRGATELSSGSFGEPQRAARGPERSGSEGSRGSSGRTSHSAGSAGRPAGGTVATDCVSRPQSS